MKVVDCFFQRCSYFVRLTLKIYLPPWPILFLFKLTSSLFRAQADNLPARGQGEHQLHQQLQLPCCQVVLAPQQQDGGQVDGHLLPSNFRWHWSWELLLSAQLSCAARTFPGTRAGLEIKKLSTKHSNFTFLPGLMINIWFPYECTFRNFYLRSCGPHARQICQPYMGWRYQWKELCFLVL